MKGYVKRIGYGNKEKVCCLILFRFKKLRNCLDMYLIMYCFCYMDK